MTIHGVVVYVFILYKLKMMFGIFGFRHDCILAPKSGTCIHRVQHSLQKVHLIATSARHIKTFLRYKRDKEP
jgi:hypothetical protein